jgi:hypothetical protein
MARPWPTDMGLRSEIGSVDSVRWVGNCTTSRGRFTRQLSLHQLVDGEKRQFKMALTTYELC